MRWDLKTLKLNSSLRSWKEFSNQNKPSEICVCVCVCRCINVSVEGERRQRSRGFGLPWGIITHREEKGREHRDRRREAERESLKKGSRGDRRKEAFGWHTIKTAQNAEFHRHLENEKQRELRRASQSFGWGQMTLSYLKVWVYSKVFFKHNWKCSILVSGLLSFITPIKLKCITLK